MSEFLFNTATATATATVEVSGNICLSATLAV
jgi:hypothetical protein